MHEDGVLSFAMHADAACLAGGIPLDATAARPGSRCLYGATTNLSRALLSGWTLRWNATYATPMAADTLDLVIIYNRALAEGDHNVVLACGRADTPGVLQLAAGGPISEVGHNGKSSDGWP